MNLHKSDSLTSEQESTAHSCKGFNHKGKPCSKTRNLNEQGYCSWHAEAEKGSKINIQETIIDRDDYIAKIGSALDQQMASQGFQIGVQESIISHGSSPGLLPARGVEDCQIIGEKGISKDQESLTIKVREPVKPPPRSPPKIEKIIGKPRVKLPEFKPVLPKKKAVKTSQGVSQSLGVDVPMVEGADLEYDNGITDEYSLPTFEEYRPEEEDIEPEDEISQTFYQEALFNSLKWAFEQGVLSWMETKYPERYEGLVEAFRSDKQIGEEWPRALGSLCQDLGIPVYKFRPWMGLSMMVGLKISMHQPPAKPKIKGI